MEAAAARYCDDIQVFQPQGPIALAGFSFGGLLAYEVARQLSAAGRDIALLAIFDTGPDLSAGGSLKDRATRVMLFLQNLPRWMFEDLIRSANRDTPVALWRSIRKYISRSSRVATPGALPRVEHLFDVSGWSPALYVHVENNLRILSAFEYRPYPGQVVLFRARVRPLFHAQTWDLGWAAVASQVRVVETPGNHHTIMEPPHIRFVAARLREIVDGK